MSSLLQGSLLQGSSRASGSGSLHCSPPRLDATPVGPSSGGRSDLLRMNAHTPVVIRAHCPAHVNRYGPCPACQRASLAATQTQMDQATGLKTKNPTGP